MSDEQLTALQNTIHPHPVLPHIAINYLIRDIRNCHIPVHSHRISNHIKAVMDLLPPVTHKGKLRARALGSTRAVLAGASVDEVVTHGNWSSQAIFDTFYRLSRETTSNMSALVLTTSS